MSTAARIDELRKKFEENPRRYFAPLANELRKAGNLSEAIGLCREFLPKQPEHMSGYIVFGQALYESGDLSEARTVFEQALALDPENLKALRYLGDIAKWEGDNAGARRWYERVLEADPRNDDIAAQLATLATPVYVVPVVPEPEPAAPTTSAFFAPPTAVPPAPPSFTPAFSLTPIGLGAIPTPDAALRAVDFDEVNARLREPEVQPTANEATLVPSAAAPMVGEHDLLDLDAIEAAGDDPFGFTDAAIDDIPFEEGLIAPEWPDTSALVGRVATPRSVTPAFVAAITPDAVAAFGIELGDPRPAPALDEDALMVDIDAPLKQSEARPNAVAVARNVETKLGITSELEPENDYQTKAETVEGVAVVESQAEAEATADAATVDEIDDGEPAWILAAAPVTTPLVENELPWLAPAPERDAVVDNADAAFGEAAAPVDDECDTMAAALLVDDASPSDDSEPDAAEGSFADVLPEEYNPAFVTETMGELLVSQGLTAQAVAVYEELARRRSYDPLLALRLAELQERLNADAVRAVSAFPTPAVATPAFVPRVTPHFATPWSVTPWSVTPWSVTPLSVTPIPSAVFQASELADVTVTRVTARERFARLASRRVPRRTPPRASVAVETPAEGLASLFGGDTPMHDDLAARALADAFAPIHETAPFGGELPFDEAMLGGASRSPTPMRAATPIATAAVSELTGGPFSFDRFFPDPATSASPQHTPAHSPSNTPAHSPSNTPASESAREVAPPTVSDDLAQFSAWLKGLGNP